MGGSDRSSHSDPSTSKKTRGVWSNERRVLSFKKYENMKPAWYNQRSTMPEVVNELVRLLLSTAAVLVLP
eukprot:SAG25_NODE_14590_length_253_cov_0.662338_1_plen_69_part_10